MLSHKGIVTLDEERKAAMVSNLLVVLCGERGAQPIVNTGHDLSVEDGDEPSARPSCCASTRRCWTRVQRWANDDLRSLNGQIEFVLRRVLKQEGRLGRARGRERQREGSKREGIEGRPRAETRGRTYATSAADSADGSRSGSGAASVCASASR